VRILVNEIDIIPENLMGMDPVDGWEESFLGQPALTNSGNFTYARCSCGIVGCGSDIVEITRSEETVSWRFPSLDRKSTVFGGARKAVPLVFDRQQYDEAVDQLKTNFDWETVERTAERLIHSLDFSRFLEYGLKFQWATGRTENKVAVSFGLQEGEAKYQILSYAPWNHEVASDAVFIVERMLKEPPSVWSDVVYYFQSQVRPRPKLAGPGWQEHSLNLKK